MALLILRLPFGRFFLPEFSWRERLGMAIYLTTLNDRLVELANDFTIEVVRKASRLVVHSLASRAKITHQATCAMCSDVAST